MNSEACQRLIKLSQNHLAWLLLASRNGPLILGGLQSLVDALALFSCATTGKIAIDQGSPNRCEPESWKAACTGAAAHDIVSGRPV